MMDREFDSDGFEEFQRSGIQKAMRERKLTQQGHLLVSLMRVTNEANLTDLEHAVWKMYEDLELHEIRAACDRRSPEIARAFVSSAYRTFTESVRVREQPKANAIYKIQTPDDASESDSIVHLIAIHVRTNTPWEEMNSELLDSFATEASARAQMANKGLDGFKISFGGKSAVWFTPGFMENLKMHVLFDIFMRMVGQSQSQESVWNAFGLRSGLMHMLDTCRSTPGDREVNASFVVLGVAQDVDSSQCINLFTAKSKFIQALKTVLPSVIDGDPPDFSTGPACSISDIGVFSEVYDSFLNSSRRANFRRIVTTSLERAGVDRCHVCAAWVCLDDPNRFLQELRIGVWRESGAFVYGTSWIISALDDKALPEQNLRELCREVSLELSMADPTTFDKVTTDRGSNLYPDRNGMWLDPQVQVAGKGASLIRTAQWEGFNDDPYGSLSTVPFPTYVLAVGAVEVMQKHYQPKLYSRLKELLAKTEFSNEDVYAQLEASFPEFRDLACNCPSAALPTDELLIGLRHHWSKSPIMVVKKTLEERLMHTDVGLDLPIGMVATPFPMSYIHFEERLQSLSFVEEGLNFSPLGVFVHEHRSGFYNKNCYRVIELGFIAATDDNQQLTLVDFSLEFASEDETIAQAMAKWKAAINADDDEEWFDFADLLVEEVIKVFLYIGSPGAIQVPHEPRKNLLASLKGKSEGQKLKAQRQLGVSYDYILVGPDEAFETGNGGDGSRTVKPHFRRGHGRHVSFGKGRLQKRMVLFPPVVVNKHLLGQDPDTWPKARNYRLK
ncbi:hypothetical protein Rfer_4428 (plasmid) [Rhodoferax ferrireducens T118]|uniref:Uncharacterized protein n=1 Tax=Albidiferax ferrireducens (strain ATCC BAA-621 / DSM 15236 / T118) TaxID=338969 RepID=Q21Q31_ALBFT|nr:hypothetical protein [Rhodoferax ferrireducens]ABD72114.1 hypothetical protein Rfer_4428 [Rhodoferax ferrireducens T118]